MSTDETALTPRSSVASPRSGELRHIPVVPIESEALSPKVGDDNGALPREFKLKKVTGATTRIKMKGLQLQVMYRTTEMGN